MLSEPWKLFLCLHNSIKLLPVVEQLYCGYCVKAIARLMPSRFISSSVALVNGLAYLNGEHISSVNKTDRSTSRTETSHSS